MNTLERTILLPEMDAEKVANEIGDFIIEKTLSSGATGGVIGLSGGVDSTTASALTKKAFDRYNASSGKNFELVGYILPSSTNNPADAEDGIKVANRLGIRHEEISIQPVLDAYRHSNLEAFASFYDRGNLSSRIRATILNTKGATEKKLVIGTGNKDEDFGIGYYTLFGDGAVHISPIGSLSKRLVRQMASHLGFNDLANRIPTAGLEPGQTDFKDLGYHYDFVEAVTEGIAQKLTDSEIKANRFVSDLGMNSKINYELKFGKTKFESVENMVDDVLRRHRNYAIPKGQLVSPPIAKVSLIYR